jgi:hypothetical protein
MAIFDAKKNVPLERASNLIFNPPDYDACTNTWDGERQMDEYDPMPEQIVEWALAPAAGRYHADQSLQPAAGAVTASRSSASRCA